MKRILSLLLAAALTAALLACPAAAAATAPWVLADGQSISLQGLSGYWSGVQLTLKLNQTAAPGDFAFDPALSGGESHATCTVSGDSLTLYVTAHTALNRDGTLPLGFLTRQGLAVKAVSDLRLIRVASDPEDTRLLTYPAPTVSDGSLPFLDAGPDAWYRDAVAFVYHTGLMRGTGDTAFTPDGDTTRGMVVTILYRYEGAPEAGRPAFRDVAPGSYYEAPIAWAAASGVVQGVSSTQFAPDQAITREQMAVILYRYAQKKGVDVSGRASLSSFADADRISPYAVDAMGWAVHTGLINGVDSRTLQPGGSATRAQVAAILMRLCTYMERQS